MISICIMTSADFTNKNNPECYAYTKFGENVTFTRGVLYKTKTKVIQNHLYVIHL